METPFQILGQVHDAIVFQFLEERRGLIDDLRQCMDIPVKMPSGSTMRIPSDVAVGYNWAHTDPKKRFFEDGNPAGLTDFGPDESQVRTFGSILDATL